MGPGAGEHGGQVVAQGTPEEIRVAAHSLTGQYLAGHRQIPIPARRHRVDPARMLTITGARGNNLRNVTLEASGRRVRVRHRRLGLRQVDAHQRHAVPRGRAAPLRQRGGARAARRDPGHRVLRQGDQRRPEPDRPDAALESGHVHGTVHADPRALRAGEVGARARLWARALLVQRERRALRGVPGRRAHQGRDALPSRHLRALRRVPRAALQSRDARDPVQGEEHPRSAVDDGRAGGPVLRAGALGRAQARDASRRRSRLHHAGAVGDHALRRRGAAREARARALEARYRPHAVHPRRADDRAFTSTTSKCCSTCCTGCAITATRSS